LHNFWVVVSAITTNYEESIFWSLGYGMENGSDEVLGVMWLLKDYDLLAETRAMEGKLSPGITQVELTG